MPPPPDPIADAEPVIPGARQTGTIERGTVASFDAKVGLGTVRRADGTSYDFHCTAVSDGSRSIEVGRAVAFVVGPAGPGRWEARTVDPLD